MTWKDKCEGWLHDDENIKGFFGDYRWMSNFHMCEVEYEGILYPSSEHAYQAAKSTDEGVRRLFTTGSAADIKSLGRKITMRSDWESVKYQVMSDILLDKFLSHPNLKQKLLDTGNKYLEETNWWKDKIWGVYRGEGTNWLGKILMEIREKLR